MLERDECYGNKQKLSQEELEILGWENELQFLIGYWWKASLELWALSKAKKEARECAMQIAWTRKL